MPAEFQSSQQFYQYQQPHGGALVPQPAPRQDRAWFYLSVLLIVAFCAFQGWQKYQESI